MTIHGDKLRWLFWMRWKTFVRAFSRGGIGRIIGAILVVIFSIFFMGGVAIGTFFLYRYLPAPANTEVLFIVLTALFVFWIVLPLMEISGNEGLDLSKLALFPLTRAELMASLLFSTLLDLPTIGLFLVLGAVVVGWATSVPLALIALLAVVIFYVQLVGISQLVVALLQGVAHSRRFRDLSFILIFLIASSSYYLCQLAFRSLGSINTIEGLLHTTVSPYLQWLPPGMAARAIQQATIGNWGMSFAWLAGLVVIDLVVLYLWLLVTQRALTVAEEGGTVKAESAVSDRASARAIRQAELAGSATGTRRVLLPPQMRAMLIKDLKYIRRDPQIMMLSLQSLLLMVFFVAYFGLMGINSRGGGNVNFLSFFGLWAVIVAPVFVLISLFSLAYNVLGMERQSLTTLFLFPIPPKYILWSKNLQVAVIGIVEMTLIAVIVAAITHAWGYVLPGLTLGLAGLGILLGIGNFTSIFFPQRVRTGMRGLRSGTNLTAEGGCLRALMSMLAFYGTLFVLIPVALGIILPIIFHSEWIWALSIPLSLLYGGGIYYIITRLVTPRMLSKTPEILAITTKEE